MHRCSNGDRMRRDLVVVDEVGDGRRCPFNAIPVRRSDPGARENGVGRRAGRRASGQRVGGRTRAEDGPRCIEGEIADETAVLERFGSEGRDKLQHPPGAVGQIGSGASAINEERPAGYPDGSARHPRRPRPSGAQRRAPEFLTGRRRQHHLAIAAPVDHGADVGKARHEVGGRRVDENERRRRGE